MFRIPVQKTMANRSTDVLIHLLFRTRHFSMHHHTVVYLCILLLLLYPYILDSNRGRAPDCNDQMIVRWRQSNRDYVAWQNTCSQEWMPCHCTIPTSSHLLGYGSWFVPPTLALPCLFRFGYMGLGPNNTRET